MHRPARDLSFGMGHEQATLAKNPLPANNTQINSDDREKLQACAQAPEVRQLLKAHAGNALIKLQRLARNASPLAQQQLSHEEGDLHKKIPSGFFGARRHAQAAAPMQQTHDSTTSATPSFLARSRAARDLPNCSSRDKGRGQRAPEVICRDMGGGQTMVENNRTPLGRCRGRGGRPEARRPTILHSQSPEHMDETSRYALFTARIEAFEINTAKRCQELWATTCMDYGPPPPAAPQERPPEDVSKAPESAGYPMASPTATQPQEQRLQETAMNSTEQVMISSEETYRDNHGGPEPITSDTVINEPVAAQSATEAHSSIRRQWQAARSKSSSNSCTACFGFDTPVLIESQGFAQWKMFYQAEKGESVVQFLPSGNIMDLHNPNQDTLLL